MSTRVQAALAGVGIAAAFVVELSAGIGWPSAAGDGVAGAATLVAGVATLAAARARPAGVLLLLTGAAWLAGTLSGGLVFVHRGPLVHLVLAYPRARPGTWATTVVIAAGYACAVITPAARSAGVTLMLSALVVAAAAARRESAGGAERRARTAALAAAAAVGAAFSVAAVGRLEGGSLNDGALWILYGAVTLVAAGLAADARHGRWERAAVTEIAADIAALGSARAGRDRLARTLGDPALQVGFATADGYADHAGKRLDLTGEGRAVSYVEDGGRPAAALVHDPALRQDGRLLGAALSAVQLAVANERMVREVRDGVSQLEASQRRLVEVAIEQRRGLEEELRTGAEQRLVDVAHRLRGMAVAESLQGLVANVERARQDLRRFGQGIHPVVLTDHGLRSALSDSAALWPFAVVLDVLDERLPASVEATIFFLCAEAFANAGKHAAATRVEISVRRTDDGVVATIDDDGAGGADVAAGTGLRGLADRVAALGGTLSVDSPHGGGTRLVAAFPI